MNDHHGSDYKKGSLTLSGSIAMGTGVIIGAGIFALTGQVAELAGGLFPLAIVAAAVVVAFSAFSYVKVCNKYPSAGGIAMILKKVYGPGVVTAGGSLLMYFSIVINESLVARTFGTYAMRSFGKAFLGVIFYIVLDMTIHWGVFRHLRRDIGAKAAVLIVALVLDATVIGAFVYIKALADPVVVIVSAMGMVLIFGGEWWFIRREEARND